MIEHIQKSFVEHEINIRQQITKNEKHGVFNAVWNKRKKTKSDKYLEVPNNELKLECNEVFLTKTLTRKNPIKFF